MYEAFPEFGASELEVCLPHLFISFDYLLKNGIL